MRFLTVFAVTFLASAVSAAEGNPEERRLRPRNEATFREILNAAKDPNRDVRSRVAWIIGRAGREDGLPTLARLALDPAPDVRAAALLAACEIVPDGTRVEVSLTLPVEDANLRNAALLAARHLLFDQRDALIQAGLESRSDSERVLAVRALRLDPPEKTRSAIRTALESSHPLVRAAAVEVLGNSDDPEGLSLSLLLDALAERASDDSFIVRAAACGALARIGALPDGKALRDAVKDEHYFVRREAIKALVERKDRNGIPAIQRRIAEEDYTVRECACFALGEMPDVTSAPPLAARLEDEVVEVRDAAEGALMRFPGELGYAALLEYADYRGDKDTRERAWRVLAAYAHPATADAAVEHLEDSNSLVGGYALRIGRKLGDRRIIPYVVALLRISSTSRLTVLKAEEAFRAAALFKLREPIRFAMYLLRRATKPPAADDREWVPSGEEVPWAAKYLAAVDHQPAVPLLEKVLTHRTFVEWRKILVPVAEALEQLTGREYPLPPEKPAPPSWDPLFIDVKEEKLPAYSPDLNLILDPNQAHLATACEETM